MHYVVYKNVGENENVYVMSAYLGSTNSPHLDFTHKIGSAYQFHPRSSAEVVAFLCDGSVLECE